MDRRTFITLTGAIGAGVALASVPTTSPSRQDGALLSIPQPGTYRISGVVRLEAPTVEISGIANTQSLSWAGLPQADLARSSFMSCERFDKAGVVRNIQVRGGRLESLSAVLVDI
jgi:hypothetical protein